MNTITDGDVIATPCSGLDCSLEVQTFPLSKGVAGVAGRMRFGLFLLNRRVFERAFASQWIHGQLSRQLPRRRRVRSTLRKPGSRRCVCACGAGIPFSGPLRVRCGAPRRATKTLIVVFAGLPRKRFVAALQAKRASGLSVGAWTGGREEERRLGPEQARGPACASQVHGRTRG